jgi:hypothetical protein
MRNEHGEYVRHGEFHNGWLKGTREHIDYYFADSIVSLMFNGSHPLVAQEIHVQLKTYYKAL